jgi:homogentisate phytyltransferase/homogentisate geranylgeranyltransferase
VRGGLINWGFVAHAATLLVAAGGAATGMGAVGLATLRSFAPVAFFTVFGTVIALIKDVPDVKGDAKFGIRSFSVRTSPTAVLKVATSLLCLTYAAASALLGYSAARAAADVALPAALRRGALAAGGMLTAIGIQRRAAAVAPDDSAAVYALYMTLWRHFYLAYAFLPFCR